LGSICASRSSSRSVSPGSGKELGILDVRYGHVFQPYELSLAASDATAAPREGVRLRMVKGAVPAFFLHPDAHAELPNVALRPHLLDARSAVPAAEFPCQLLLSTDSVQMFGWMQGCTLDGLLAAEPAWKEERVMPVLQAHLGLFFRPDGSVVYEDPRSEPADNRIYGIEGLLPYAVLAHVQPNHGALDLAARSARSRAGSDGVIDGANTTTEGCYTLAYPLAAIARAKEDAGLAALALHNLIVHKERLTSEDAIYQRAAASGEKGFRNWSRGVAWYLLALCACCR
jgi:unsaturated rhamnogalacturonyl hydrolase